MAATRPSDLDSRLLSDEPAARSKNFALWPFKKYNHNVVVGWLNCLTSGVADSVWTGTVLASYLYELMGKSNVYAGYVEAAQGITNLVVALPLGWVADRTSKARVIAVGALIIPVAVAASSFAVIYGVEQASKDRTNSDRRAHV